MLKTLLRYVRNIVLVIAAIVVLYAGTNFVLSMLGYYPDGLGWRVAKQIAQTSRDPHDCFKIIHLIPHVMAPSEGEQRGLCVYELAEITKDPTVCELLLPSEYGLACTSNIWPGIADGINCAFEKNDRSIFFCRNDDGTFRRSKNCDDFSANKLEHSSCIEHVAEREKRLTLCQSIPDEPMRTFCEVRLGAWEKYPELRNSSYFGTIKPLEE